MNLDKNFRTVYFTVKKKNLKALLLGISLIGTLITVNAYGTAFAGDSLNSINPNFQGDQSSSSSSDNTESSDQQPQSSSSSSDNTAQKQPMNPMGKAFCNTTGSVFGQAIGNLIAPGIGGALGGAVGSNLCANQ